MLRYFVKRRKSGFSVFKAMGVVIDEKWLKDD